MAHGAEAIAAGDHVLDRLVSYLVGGLTDAQASFVDVHLLGCAACRTEYAELSAVALAVAVLLP